MEIKVLKARNNEGKNALLIAQKDNSGFWRASVTGYAPGHQQIAEYYCSEQMGNRIWKGAENTPDNEYHQMFWGDNAKRLIEIPSSALPEGVAINVQQDAKEYFIHTIRFSTYKPEEGISCWEKMYVDIPGILESLDLIGP